MRYKSRTNADYLRPQSADGKKSFGLYLNVLRMPSIFVRNIVS